MRVGHVAPLRCVAPRSRRAIQGRPDPGMPRCLGHVPLWSTSPPRESLPGRSRTAGSRVQEPRNLPGNLDGWPTRGLRADPQRGPRRAEPLPQQHDRRRRRCQRPAVPVGVPVHRDAAPGLRARPRARPDGQLIDHRFHADGPGIARAVRICRQWTYAPPRMREKTVQSTVSPSVMEVRGSGYALRWKPACSSDSGLARPGQAPGTTRTGRSRGWGGDRRRGRRGVDRSPGARRHLPCGDARRAARQRVSGSHWRGD